MPMQQGAQLLLVEPAADERRAHGQAADGEAGVSKKAM
jgi:hypothetical protein